MRLSTFRTIIGDWLSSNLGEEHIFTIDFDVDFVASNVISGTVSAVAFDTVNFDTDHDTTISLLAESLQALESVLKAEVTADRQITITALDVGDLLTASITVTGGASQAVATSTSTQTPETVQCIYDFGKMPKLTYPYATFRLSGIRPVSTGHNDEIDPDTNLALHSEHLVATLTVNYFGEDALGKITKAYNSLGKNSVFESFNSNGIAIDEKQQIQDLTALLDTHFEPRAAFDVAFRFKDTFEQDLGLIESVEVTGTFEGTGDDITVGPNTIEI